MSVMLILPVSGDLSPFGKEHGDVDSVVLRAHLDGCSVRQLAFEGGVCTDSSYPVQPRRGVRALGLLGGRGRGF